MRVLLDRLVGWWSEHPFVDYVTVAFVTASHILVVVLLGMGDVLAGTDLDQRLELYAASAGVVSVIGGVTSVALALYQSLGGERGGAVRRHYGDEVRRNWRALLVTTGFTPAVCVLSMALDREPGNPLLPRFLLEVALLLAASRFLRLVWLFDAFLHVDDASRGDKGKGQPLAFNPGWGPRPDTPKPVTVSHRNAS